jgi:osmotically-inducible protein OsmY
MSGNEFCLECLVSQALLFSATIGNAVIEVKDNKGVVTLKGTVESKQDKVTAEQLARQQEGVVDVINNLHIFRPY